MKTIRRFPHAVRVIENSWIPMSDGCRLAARIWLPADADTAPVPAILEYIPYRKRDFTRARDEPMHHYFAGYGYAAVRVDLRGSGDSDGLLLDESLKQEHDDALEVIRWIAEQPWCSGAVGMMGKSWGGFNSLQVAARRPPELKAIITVCSTDDRYLDDVHYMGPMLKEEAFHLFTGQSGLSRVLKAGKIPVELIQKYLNKWISTGQDLLGKDHSSSALRFYRWGFKGRFDEETALVAPEELERLNEHARRRYYDECCEIINALNQLIPSDALKLRAPDPKFNRQIGEFTGQTYSVEGRLLSESEYRKHLKKVLPQARDLETLEAITKTNDWVSPGQVRVH